jgi:serine/threonine protein kinase/Tol biopolymer transport system component
VTRERWRELEELYHAAIAAAPEERIALLERADPEVRATLASMLAQESDPPASGFSLDRPAWEGRESLLATLSIMSLGTQLGPYRIEKEIGRGGMGEVFRATDTRLNRTVAIKASMVHFTDRFEREARAIATLNHPHVATLYDVGSTPSGLSYLVLEYVEGPTLAELISKGPIEPDEVRRIALQTAEAIEAAHEKGIVHRDLKPANIKLGEANVVKVLDFGLAKVMNEAHATPPGDTTQRGVILGTPSYMAPEQALGAAADRRSDIWSFGVLLAEMLSGKQMFAGSTTSEILESVVRGEPDLSGVPPEWLPLLKRCLTKDVRRRLQAIGEARIALENGFEVETVHEKKTKVPWAWIALSAGLILCGAILWANRAPVPSLDNPLANATFTPLTDSDETEADASISPDGRFVAFLSDRGGVSHVWLDEIGVSGPVDLTPGPEDWRRPLRSIGFSRDGAEIWVSGTEKRRLVMLPLLGGKPRLFLNEKAVSPTWSPDGTKLAYHTSEPGDPIFVADRDGSNARQIFRDLPDKHNHYLAWGADENWIYFVNGTPATFETDLWRIPAAGGTPERLTTQNRDMRDPTPLRGTRVLYIAGEHDRSGPWLWSFDLTHRVSHRIAFGLEQYTSLSASSDGERLAVTVSNPTVRLWSVPIRDTIVTEADVKPFPPDSRRAIAPRFRGGVLYYLSSLGAGDRLWKFEAGRSSEIWGAGQGLAEPPAISPDGTRIALLTRRNGKRRLRLVTADGTESSEIAPELEVEGSAAWSPDGRWIVTGGNDGHGEGLFKIPITGGAPIRLTKTIGRNPVWSPDGSMIAYSGPNVFTLEPLLIIRPDGTPVRVPEIRTHRDGERLRFTPDGRGLVYMQGSEATPWQDFWLLNLTTMKTRRLTELKDRATMRTFDVTPDGKHIVFDRERENSAVVLIDLHIRQ